MRIIAGRARGLTLKGPPTDRVRPTADRVRESIFAILGDFEDAIVVDGFAGTGALGCEALSRGAALVYFFDSSYDAIEVVRENVGRIEAENHALIYKVSFERGLGLLEHDPDLIFIDPPYGRGLTLDALDALAACETVTSGAMVVVEESTESEPLQHAAFDLEDLRLFGQTRVVFYVRQ